MTTKITQKTELLELLYSEEIEIINTFINEGKAGMYENGKIEIPFDKVFINGKDYTRENLIHIADIFENFGGWYVKINESEEVFDFS